MADDDTHLSSSFLQHPKPSLSTSKLCSQTYKTASQLFLTRRLQESLSALEPIFSTSASQEDDCFTNGDDAAASLAPIASASSTLRIKIWNLYITLLNAVVDLGPDEGKKALGQKEWKALVSKVRDGDIWETIVQTGYKGLEGSVDADVVHNLATLLLNQSPSQALNQQRLEAYLSSYGQPSLDLANRLQNEPAARPDQMPGANGTDTPKDLAARVRIIELFTLHVLPRNEEWTYAREFIRLSEVLDEERKESFLHTLDGLEEEKDRGRQRAAELQREKEAELERQSREQRRRKSEESAVAEHPQGNGIIRTSSETDYGIERECPTGVSKSRPSKLAGGSSIAPSGRATISPPRPPSRSSRKTDQSVFVARQARALINVLQHTLHNLAHNVRGNPVAFLRTLLFMLGIIIAFSKPDIRNRIRRLLGTCWQKVKGTIGMGMKVSYM
ncbi:hypothetical protein V8E54_008988 [Elaphomyces granulatus]